MNQKEKNSLYVFLKKEETTRNNKVYTARKSFDDAYEFFCFNKDIDKDDYINQVHPWFAIRYAFDWSKDCRNGEAYWKTINKRWEDYCIAEKIANSGMLNCLTIEELKIKTREMFGDTQCVGTNQTEAVEYLMQYVEERDEINRKKKEVEEAEMKRKREQQLKEQKEREAAKAKESAKTIDNPVWSSSVKADDTSFSEDFIDEDGMLMLNPTAARARKLNKGEIRIESTSNFRITFSTADSEDIEAYDLEYLCCKKDRTLVICNDKIRGARLNRKEGSHIYQAQSKILVEYLKMMFSIKADNCKLKISENISTDDNAIMYHILSVIM